MGRTETIAEFVVDHAKAVGTVLLLATLFFFYPVANAGLAALGQRLPGPVVRIDSDARSLFPDHPFIRAQDKFEGHFGSASPVALILEVKEGTIFTPDVLSKLKRITNALDGIGFDSRTDEREARRQELADGGMDDPRAIRSELDRHFPPYPVDHDQTRSLLHWTTRMTVVFVDGSTIAEVLAPEIPKTQAEADAFRQRVRDKAAEVIGRHVTSDEKAALVTVQFTTDRLSNIEIYRAVFEHIQKIVDDEQTENHRIHVVGTPIITGWVLQYVWEIMASMVGAIVVIFILLWAYFRRLHGVVIPMIAAFATVIWGTGFTGWMDIAFDPLVLVIPMIITARAVSHTVQMAERFFEDYERFHPLYADPEDAKRKAAISAMAELIIPGSLGILTDVAGLLVILVTTIPQMRDLGVFGAFWVASIVFTVELLHPVLISLMPAPRQAKHHTPRLIANFADAIGGFVTHEKGRWVVAIATVAIFSLATWVVLFHSVIGESRPGTSLFWPDHPFNAAVGVLGKHFGGADNLVVYLEGNRDHAVEETEAIQSLEDLGRRLRLESGASHTLSIVELIRLVNQASHDGEPKYAYVPEGASIKASIWMTRQGAPPGTLRPLITDDGRAAALQVFYPNHKGETIRAAITSAERFIEENPMGQVAIRLSEDRGDPSRPFFDAGRLEDLLYYTLGPLLPTRSHTLGVVLKDEQGVYQKARVMHALSDGLPGWIDDFRAEAHVAYEVAEQDAFNGRVFTWPEHLANWGPEHVDEWWEDEELGIRAVAIGEDALMVHDQMQIDSLPSYQPTQAFTRGVQWVLAGGMLGMLAAVNDEVERGHLVNITLIFIAIFILHSCTYRSSVSGAIILLQIATATVLSLAYMAFRGVGLNIHTLPVQAVGVGIGVDYAIYIVDRIRQECGRGIAVDSSIRLAIRTTGTAVTFTATTVVAGIFFWIFSNLRFQAEMAQLLIVLMVINMLGAITIVPAFYSILKPGGIDRVGKEPTTIRKPVQAP